MQAVLVMFRSDGERRSFSVTRDMTVIGRREDCDLRIPLGDISRKHARLVRDGDTLRLEDLGSSNGTFLNGQRVQEAVLNPGDSVQLGPVVFVLQIDGHPADEELQPVMADASEHAAPEPVPTDTGPLSPTSQSDLDDHGHLEALPALDDADEGLGLESLTAVDDDAALELEPMPALHEDSISELEPLSMGDDEPLHGHLSDAGGEDAGQDVLPELDLAELEIPTAAKEAKAAASPPPALQSPRVPPIAASRPKIVDDSPLELEPLPLADDEAVHDLSPTAGDETEMELLPDEGEAPIVEHSALPMKSTPPASHPTAAKPTAEIPGDPDFDLETLPELGDDETLELLPDEPAHGHIGHNEAMDLDFGLDSHPHPHA